MTVAHTQTISGTLKVMVEHFFELQSKHSSLHSVKAPQMTIIVLSV